MIRLAYVLSNDVRAGIEEHVLSLVEGLDRNRFQVFVVAPPRLVEAFGTDLTDLDVTVEAMRIGALADIPNRVRFWRFLRKNRIDIVNTHMFETSRKYMPLAVMARVPVRLETAHGIEQWRLDKGWIGRKSFVVDRWAAKMLTKILAVSYGCKNRLIDIKGIPSEKIVVVQNGRSVEAFDPALTGDARQRLRKRYGISDDEFVFGVMARLEPQKGHKYLLEAVSRLAERRQGFRVLLVGEGEQRDGLLAMASRLGISDRVVFAGFTLDVAGHFAAMDVKVLPSLWEGMALCLIEAMAMEKPVIATDVDGTGEVVQHKVHGLLVPSKDISALTEAMEYAMDNRADFLQLGCEGRKWVTQRFSLARQIRETEQLYESLAAEAGVGGSR